jgi:uncharacterized FAD-dependent dehydrogenase
MSQTIDLFLPLGAQEEPLDAAAARALGITTQKVRSVRIIRRSLDARKAHAIGNRLRLEVTCQGETDPEPAALRVPVSWPRGIRVPRIVIVGSGPAGSWAALRLAEAGVPSTVLERGKTVQPRRHDLAHVQRGKLDTDSNYCFGEGGAGTFSDGKLYTRTKARLAVQGILADLVRFGAPPDILIDARPHVGSNRLPKVLSSLRTFLESQGVSYRFSCAFDGIVARNGRVCGVRLRDGGELEADAVVLAAGHSARDVYSWAARAGIALERKGSAVGVRLEHPQSVINRIQYGKAADDARLPPAFYEVSATGANRGVYSFCMCPGGFIVPAATESEGVVVNGMSLSRRDSRFANAAMVVSVGPEDFGPDADGPLAGVEFQRRIEERAFAAGGGGFRAPAQRLSDFLANRSSASLPETSYHPGVFAARIDDILPGFVSAALREGLIAITRRMRGFLEEDALLVGAETRTSAPIRIVRDPTTLQSPSLVGLYPAGEGAGYAGGIVSAAIDGVRVADAILAPGP